MKKIAALLLALLLFTAIAFAEDGVTSGTGVEELLSGSGAEELSEVIPPQAQQLLPNTDGGMGGVVDSVQPATLLNTIAQMVKQYLQLPLTLLVSLCGVMVLCAMVEIFSQTLSNTGSASLFQVLVSVAVASLIVTPVVGCITEAANTLQNFSVFITTFIPVFSGVLTAAGQPLTASAYNIFLFWICQTTAQLISSYFVPLLCGYLALTVIAPVCPSLQLGKLVGGIRSFVVWGLTLTLTVFVGLLSIQSVVASSGDHLSVKTAKFMIGSLIPGVGGALSDLFVAAQGCIQLAKGTLGAFGVVVTLFTFLPIVLQVTLWYLSLNIAALIGSILGTNEVASLMKSTSSAVGILLAVLLYDALLVIISTTIIIVAFGAR
ncbi:MAG: hypothetical protein RR185_07115 [Angelakisella sp.]